MFAFSAFASKSSRCAAAVSLLRHFSSGRFNCILTEVRGAKKNVALVTLHRPKALNALCVELMNEMDTAIKEFDNDPAIKAIIITGSEKAFAAGADIKEMMGRPFAGVYRGNFLSSWEHVSEARKPVIAAVNGFALGGGCELAMMCDVIYAGHKARFGQPEIKLGTIPGAGGTQRLTAAIGKSKTMEMVLTGDMISAEEAHASGLVSKVFPADQLVDKAVELGEKIGEMSAFAVQAAKEAVNTSFNTTLREGLHFEKRLFHMTFASNDCKEGMTAFAEKREAKFTDS